MNLIGKLFFAVRISQDFDQLSHNNQQQHQTFQFPTKEFVTASENKGKPGNWDWWFQGVNIDDKSKKIVEGK